MSGNEHYGLIVQERDRQLLTELAVMQVIDREQAKIVAGFRSTTRANVRLLALVRAGLLRRFFLGTGGGGKKALYAISEKGAQLAGVPYRGPRRRQNEMLVADFFIQHQFTVNQIYCALKYQMIPVPGITFRRWIAFHEPLVQGVRLIPDGYVELDTPSGTLAAFLEVDLGHESLTVWKEKVRNYLRFALSGDLERRFGQSRFRVLVIAPSERRFHSIRKTVALSTQKIFWFASFPAIRSAGLFGSAWFRPTGEVPQPLLQELS
jgi:Replication-relaxation